MTEKPSQQHRRPDHHQPELLAPAGDRDCVRAAIENGADAVYFGLQSGFNARGRAGNFTTDELADVMVLLHRRGVRGYLALNTLAFSNELPVVEQLVRRVAEAGVDAIMVQDLGVVQLVRNVCPDLPVHASTQMTLTSTESIAEIQRLGIQRVVLARELSLGQIRKIRESTDVELEVFVHGALCVAYSGQCLTSESLGGRSANRGVCAQACRLPYDLICDGQPVDLGNQKYLLSPQDLAAYQLVPELLETGVRSFKIEGRLKTPEYVANITRHYRRALDAAMADQAVEFSARQVEEMELSFSRGFSPGWLAGNDHKRLVPGLSSAKRGVLLGRIDRVLHDRVVVQLERFVQTGDGIVFEADRANDQEQGGRIYEIFQDGQALKSTGGGVRCELTFARGSIEFDRLDVGQRIWKTDDPKLTRRLRKSFSQADPQRRMSVDLQITATVGEPLLVRCETDHGLHCTLESDGPLERAQRHVASVEHFQQQLGRLGGTPYVLRNVQAEINGQPMVPHSVLGRLRAQMIARLDELATSFPARPLADEGCLARLRSQNRQQQDLPPTEQAVELRVLCRSLPQLEAALTCNLPGVVADFADIRQYRQAVPLAHQSGTIIHLAPPRIQKPQEMGILRALVRHDPDGILARNLACIAFCNERKVPFIADYTLNAANDLTVHQLHGMGAQFVTASYDLNRNQLLELLEETPPHWLEIVVHQHMPMFHMEHCVFCAVLSPGKNKTDCGRPCDHHKVHLRDRIGAEHRLTADIGCRNTLFNGQAQSAAEIVPALLTAGVRQFRIDLLEETPQQVCEVVDLYRDLLLGEVTGPEVWKRLNATNRVGVTRGTLEARRDPLAIL